MTTQFEPPADADHPAMTEPGPGAYGPAPLSTVALIGFIASLIICFPVFALIGLILGIIGIPATAGGKKRGRGMAIAAIVISLAVGTGWSILIYFGVIMLGEMQRVAPKVEVAFRASAINVPEVSAEVYQLSSARFRQVVSEEEFAAWVAKVIAKHGQLQDATFPMQWMEKKPIGDTIIIHRVGQFVNGTAAIDIEIAQSGPMQFEVDDIRVDGESPLDKP